MSNKFSRNTALQQKPAICYPGPAIPFLPPVDAPALLTAYADIQTSDSPVMHNLTCWFQNYQSTPGLWYRFKWIQWYKGTQFAIRVDLSLNEWPGPYTLWITIFEFYTTGYKSWFWNWENPESPKPFRTRIRRKLLLPPNGYDQMAIQIHEELNVPITHFFD